MSVPPGALIKQPKAQRAKGRARPDEPLATWCEAGIDRVCTGRAHCRHHRVRRAQGGTDERENTADLCHPCHVFIHTNPAWSFATGWLRHREAS